MRDLWKDYKDFMTSVYILAEASNNHLTGWMKAGITDEFERRMSHYKTHNPREIFPVIVMDVGSREKARDTESRILQLANTNGHGEWFHIDSMKEIRQMLSILVNEGAKVTLEDLKSDPETFADADFSVAVDFTVDAALMDFEDAINEVRRIERTS